MMERIETIALKNLVKGEILRKEVESYTNQEFFFAHKTFRPFLHIERDTPFSTPENRFVRVISGHAKYMVNLEVFELTTNDVLLVPANAVIVMLDYDEDFDMQMIMFAVDVEPKNPSGCLIHLSQKDIHRVDSYLDLLWESILAHGYRKAFFKSFVEVMINDIESIAMQKNTPKAKEVSKDSVLSRYLHLLNEFSHKERKLDFYAEELSMTPHYLSAYISKVSGRTCSEWFNLSLIQKIKLELTLTNKRINEIAFDMGFPNTSDFSRYFRTQTGSTPKDFRSKNQLNGSFWKENQK